MNLTPPFDIDSPEFRRKEFEYYRWMRENKPICPAIKDQKNHMLVTRYADVKSILKDQRFIRNHESITRTSSKKFPRFLPKELTGFFDNDMLEKDGAEHSRLRHAIHKVFTPQAMVKMTEEIDACSHTLLDQAEREGTVDLIEAYALPLSFAMSSRMLGVSDQTFRQLAIKVRAVNGTNFNRFSFFRRLKQNIKLALLNLDLHDLIEKRRADPSDDLLTALICAATDGQLTEDELPFIIHFLFFVGYETAADLIANGVHALLVHPAQLTRLREKPEHIKTAIEEIMRYTAPVVISRPNYATEDIEMDGVTIPRGTIVLPVLASANRDETVFAHPETFDITRTPNPHIALGLGGHVCLGAALARLEGQIALRNLITRFPDIRLAVEPSAISYAPHISGGHTLQKLPVTLQ